MSFTNPFFIILFTTGVIFIIAGFFLKLKPPKEINYLYGYRSKASMKNQERWNFAQTYSGKKMINSGLAMSVLGILSLFLDIGNSPLNLFGSILILLVFCAIPIFQTERAIKLRFD